MGAFGGKAYHSDEDVKINFGEGSGFTTGTAHGLNLNDSPTFGAKVSASYLPRQYKWQSQIGLELVYTKFTADLHPQIVGASGTSLTPGFELGSWIITAPQDFSVNILATNLLFRYPIWATPEMPQGRWYPYIGAGVGVERVRSSNFPPGYEAISYAPAIQGLVGLKFCNFR